MTQHFGSHVHVEKVFQGHFYGRFTSIQVYLFAMSFSIESIDLDFVQF